MLDEDFSTFRKHVMELWLSARNRPFLLEDQMWDIGCYDKTTRHKRQGSFACKVSRIFQIYFLQNSNYILRYLFHIYRQKPEIVDAAVIESAYKAMFAGVRMFGGVGPIYTYYMERLTALQALDFIIVYRDPRDVVSRILSRMRPRYWENESIMRDNDLRNWWPEEMGDVSFVAERWLHFIAQMERFADQAYVVRYEDLVTDTRPILQDLGDRFDLDPDKFNPHLIIPGGNIGEYRNLLSDQEIAAVLEVTGSTMQRLGYS